MTEPKTEFMQIRFSPKQLKRIRRVAEAEHLDVSTWARRVLMKAVEDYDAEQDS